MTKTQKNRIRFTAVFLGATALLIPVSMSPADSAPVTVTDACAEETCCRELGSVCDDGDDRLLNHYKSASGCKVEIE